MRAWYILFLLYIFGGSLVRHHQTADGADARKVYYRCLQSCIRQCSQLINASTLLPGRCFLFIVGYKAPLYTTIYNKYCRPNIGRVRKTSSYIWHLIIFPDDGSCIGNRVNSIMSGRNPPLYCITLTLFINHHVGTPKAKTKDTMSLGTAQFFYNIGSRIG